MKNYLLWALLVLSSSVLGILPFYVQPNQVRAATSYLVDTFTRTSASGWGSAETGGAYTTSNTTDFTINGSQALLSNNANATRVAYSNSVSAQDTEHLFKVKTSAAPAGGNQQINIAARYSSGSNSMYRGKFAFTTAGLVTVNFSRQVSGTETDISSATTAPGITTAPNTFYWIRMQVSGTSPTTLRARVWQDGQSEPGYWTKSVTNSQAELQTSGAVGIQSFVSGASSVSPVVFTFDDYSVSSIDTVVYSSMSDTFTRTLANGWGTADTGGLYTNSGGNLSEYSTDGSAAVTTVPTGNTNHRMYFTSFSSLDTDVGIRLKTDKLAVGSTMYHYLFGRRNDGANSEYVAQVVLNTNQTVSLRILKLVGGVETNITTSNVIPELQHSAGKYLNVRLGITGTNPTTLSAKVWGDNWKEPDWQLTASDSQAELQQAGSIGIRNYVGSGASNLPLVISYDNFSADGTVPTDAADLTGGPDNKGVNWHHGPWYDTSNAPDAYYYQGFYDDLDKMQAAGVKWVRISLNKTTQSTCSSTAFYSKIRDALNARGMEALVYVTIPNATTTTATVSEINDFNAWMTTMVNCYKDDFDYWEIGNEPNLSNFWNINSTAGSDPTAYAQSVQWYYDYLQNAYTTIKGIDPAATVIHAGLSQSNVERWMTVAATINPSAYMDAMGFHPYSDNGPAGVINYTNRLYASMQDISGMGSKPIWVTEMGFTADPAEYPGNAGGSESNKASYLSTTYQDLLNWGITTPIFWYDFNQDSSLGTTNYELVNTNYETGAYTETPAYTAMDNLWAVADTTPPVVTLTPITPDPTSDTTPTVSGTAIDSATEISAVSYQVDSTAGSWSVCTATDGAFDELNEPFSCTTATLGNGLHTIYIRASDGTNVSSDTGTSDTFTIATTAAATPAPEAVTTSTHSSSNSTTTSESGAEDCTAGIPSGKPNLFEIDRLGTSATLFFTPSSGEITRYVISYGEGSESAQHASIITVESPYGVQLVKINYLKTGLSYTFKVRALNGCRPGEWSNELTVRGVRNNNISVPFYAYAGISSVQKVAMTSVHTFKTALNNVVPAEQQSTESTPQPQPSLQPTAAPVVPIPEKVQAADTSSSWWEKLIAFFTR